MRSLEERSPKNLVRNLKLKLHLADCTEISTKDIVTIGFQEPPPVTSGTDDELSSDDGSDKEIETSSYTNMSFGRQVTWHWNKRKQLIEHEYSIAAWA